MLAAGVVEDFHTEAKVGALRQCHPDTSHAENTQRFMVHVDAELRRTDALLPVARFDPGIQFRHPTRGAQYQRHHGVRHGFGQHGRRVHQHHVTLIQRFYIKIVIAYRDAGADAQIGHLRQQLTIHFTARSQQTFCLLERRSMFLLAFRREIADFRHVTLFSQASIKIVGQFFIENYSGFHSVAPGQ